MEGEKLTSQTICTKVRANVKQNQEGMASHPHLSSIATSVNGITAKAERKQKSVTSHCIKYIIQLCAALGDKWGWESDNKFEIRFKKKCEL